MLILVNGKIQSLNRSGMMSNLGVDFGQWEDSVRHSEMMSKLCVCETSTIRPPCISRSRVHVSVCV